MGAEADFSGLWFVVMFAWETTVCFKVPLKLPDLQACQEEIQIKADYSYHLR